jgi:hypothetical protein
MEKILRRWVVLCAAFSVFIFIGIGISAEEYLMITGSGGYA